MKYLFCLFFSASLLAQERMSVSQFFVRIQASPGDSFRLSHATIFIDPKTDERFARFFNNDSLTQQYVATLDTIFVRKKLILKNVKLEGDLRFRKITFLRAVEIDNLSMDDFGFTACRFAGEFSLNQPVIGKDLSFTRVIFEENVRWTKFPEEAGWFRTAYCEFRKDFFNAGHSQMTIVLESCQFYGNNSFLSENSVSGYMVTVRRSQFKPRPRKDNPNKDFFELLNFRSFGGRNYPALEMIECNLDASSPLDVVDVSQAHFKFASFISTRFNVFVYAHYSTFDKFLVTHSSFNRLIDLRSFDFPLAKTSLNFEQISKQIIVKASLWSEYRTKWKEYDPYFAKTDKELADVYNFNELISVYSQLLGIYKYRSDPVSYNACYVEMKDIQTRKAAYDFRQRKNLPNLFAWQLNAFLRYFCDYGTNPARALSVSVYMMLLFAIVYFIFPSEEDNLSRIRFVKFLQNALQYFQTDKQLADFQKEKERQDLREMTALRENLQAARQRVPPVIRRIGMPFYALAVFYDRFTLRLLSRTDMVKGSWNELSPGKRLWLSWLVSFYFVGFVLWGLFMRLLNALALSLNVFVTLGYGEIPAKGFMRYLAVVEGVMGWFMLSIFSVSLISQML
jgi:hypothetical protein